ncbi:MAG: hydroxymethylglutaryl-CoA synthase [Calditrichaceae bacterium]|nr:hydroxymethylglutaryl-CoA synthase [Calditrichaceae bacterium]MBN2707646.1 hydroxymethylglutaryl-CoA synthase [Calditrichaceae bacterium]RQV93184.1 MAG: hydroxymethylglutaryl-CoA synthase [Calditrichota bacterium]
MSKMMKPSRDVGIVGYGAYIPAYRLPGTEISELWRDGQDNKFLPVKQKSVPGKDEDTTTMSIEAAQNALKRAKINPAKIRAIWVGSESHPYAVKPTGTVVAEVLGIAPDTLAADMEFACKAGTEAMQAGFAFVGSSMGEYALCIGADTAQGRPGDALEYTAAAGGAAFIIGPAEESLAVLEGSYSYVTDTPDFFRRAYQRYPEHGNRFTGEPAYFKHITSSVSALLEELKLKPEDFAYVVFHQPNSKFPLKVGKMLGFSKEQQKYGLLSPSIGNTYAGASVVGLTDILDHAKPGERILISSFGSGAGSDTFSFMVTSKITKAAKLAPKTKTYIDRAIPINYAAYARLRKKIIKE